MRFKAETAYTPRYDTTVTDTEWLRVSCCFPMQERVDKTVWYADVNETKVGMPFATHRDVTAWYVMRSGRDVQFQTAEVDLDASVGHIARSQDEDTSQHRGRLFIFKERATQNRKVVTMPDLDAPTGSALPPEANREIQQAVAGALRAGDIAGADGARRLRVLCGVLVVAMLSAFRCPPRSTAGSPASNLRGCGNRGRRTLPLRPQLSTRS